MDIQILGAHQGESDRFRCISILVDDVLAVDAGSITSSLSWDAQEKIRFLLLTHYHFDHVKDVATLGFNTLYTGNLRIYSTAEVREALLSHILNRVIWPDLTVIPSPEEPSVTFHVLESLKTAVIDGYEVLPVPSIHTVPTVGYQVRRGKSFYYSGDAGPGCSSSWRHISPDLLMVEVTLPNRMEDMARRVGHLTPQLLKGELLNYGDLRGSLPTILILHMSPPLEAEIKNEMEDVSQELGIPLPLAYEGMRLSL
ncbi:MAG: 3',5'-cyclic-nucleotide phosphodiesterase [Chloroflexi bacterium]|nr:3',5'-cyclic-nucleotide phosphodiesterase [Chloroflexota bacterium]